MKKHHFFNMYLTTTISVMLVLFLIGLESILLLSADNLVRQVRENVMLDVVLADQADSLSVQSLDAMLSAVPYCSSHQYVSKEQALEDHIAALGEDPALFLGYNPLNASFSVHLTAAYANLDSVAPVVDSLEALPMVERVVYQRDLLALMSRNISDATWLFLATALILLLVALALIVNTVRLQIYSKRFLIRTMTLVGATGWYIRRPFIGRYALVGTVAAVLAGLLLTGAIYYVYARLGFLLFTLTWQNLAFVAGVLFVCGNLITILASSIATGRYIRMKTDMLYEI